MVTKMYDTTNTIGMPPIAPASFGLENLAISKMTAVAAAEARLLMKISI